MGHFISVLPVFIDFYALPYHVIEILESNAGNLKMNMLDSILGIECL